jgi:hypothetical protein
MIDSTSPISGHQPAPDTPTSAMSSRSSGPIAASGRYVRFRGRCGGRVPRGRGIVWRVRPSWPLRRAQEHRSPPAARQVGPPSPRPLLCFNPGDTQCPIIGRQVFPRLKQSKGASPPLPAGPGTPLPAPAPAPAPAPGMTPSRRSLTHRPAATSTPDHQPPPAGMAPDRRSLHPDRPRRAPLITGPPPAGLVPDRRSLHPVQARRAPLTADRQRPGNGPGHRVVIHGPAATSPPLAGPPKDFASARTRC